MKNTLYNIMSVLAVFTVLAACNKFLDESPSKDENIEITTVEQLTALLDAYASSGGIFSNSAANIFCSDCFGMSTMVYDVAISTMSSVELAQMYTWQMKWLASTNYLTSEWVGMYEAIYTANIVLANLDNVSGSEEAKAEVRGRAYTLRAYSYNALLECYCLPYGQSTLSTPGLPRKTRPDYEESPARLSLEDTYAFVEDDIQEALKLNTPHTACWRESGGTANAVAARFYLNKGDYAKALQYAEAALQYYSEVLDLNSEEVYMADNGTSSIYSPEVSSSIFVPNTDRSYMFREHSILFDGIYAVPSDYLMSLYDKDHDLRYKYFYCEDAQYKFLIGLLGMTMMTSGNFDNIPGISPYAGDNYSYAPNTAEMMLIVAECHARQNEVSDAMQALNDFRRYRISSSAPSEVLNLSASDRDEAVKLILEERAREFPFSRRWNDIRRCNFNDDPADDITVTRKDFYTVGKDDTSDALTDYTLTPTTVSYYAVAIPDVEITASDGEIQQNVYE